MKKVIAKLLKKNIEHFGIKITEEQIEKFIEIPPSVEMGDYAFPCFALAGQLKMEPHEIALQIRENLRTSKDFDDIQTSGPYLNFFVNRKNIAKNILSDILKQGDKFGSVNLGNNRKVVIEHTSINPNASPHVGRARNALIGDSLVRIIKFLGFKPEVHYYVNDVSKQIAMLVYTDAENLKFEEMLKAYSKISKKVESKRSVEKDIFGILENFESGDPKIKAKFRKITKICVKGQIDILSRLGIKYDVFDYESDFMIKSRKLFEELKKTGKFHKDKEGRFYLDQASTPIKKQMKKAVLVLTRSDGTGLYPLRDIAYTIDKLKLSKDSLIVLGEDQKLYFQQIKHALSLLGFDSPKVIHYSFIMLKEKGKSKRMSTRKGDVVLLEDFIKKAVDKAKKEISKRKTQGDPEFIGIGAVKYKILKSTPNKSIIFDLDEALNFEGDTGPYILYSYARASSILRKAKAQKNNNFRISNMNDREMELIKKLSQFPEIVLSSYSTLNPSLIANYSYHLAQIFNEFYHSCPVIDSKKESFRIALVKAFKQVLGTSLDLLGIKVIERM